MKALNRPIGVLLGTGLAWSLLGAACVVTTYEGPGEPPRVLPAPLPGRPPRAETSEAAKPPPAAAEPKGSPSGDAGQAAPQEIAVSHVLVMYRGSMRAPPAVTRSKEEALERANQVLARAKAGEDFGVLAAEYSDEPGAGARGGKLGRIRREQVVKPFASAAFSLGPGELSDIVETPFGYHVILRTE